MPPPEQNTFVFIEEDQRNKYSKSTLSVINAQVAKHAHKQRRSVVKPKSKSAPSSPPSLGGAESVKNVSATTTQDDQLNKVRRRTSAPQSQTSTVIVSPRRGSSDPQTLLARQGASSPKLRKHSIKTSKNEKEAQRAEQNACETEQGEETHPEDLVDLIQNLCRITRVPAYQAFPCFLDMDERRLAHYWFTEILKDDFGMELQLEDTFQGPLTRYPLAFQVPLRWIIARAADILHEKTGSQSLTVVYQSRAKALNRLQEILRDASTPTDEAVGSIIQSIVHNPEFRKGHLRGLDAMIESRGGLDTVIRSSKVTCAEHVFLQFTFAEFDIPNLEELEKLKSRFFSSLLSIQQQAQEFTRMMAQMENWASSADLLDCSVNGGNLQKWSYTEQRQRTFSEKTATGQVIRQVYDRNENHMRKSRLFAALFQIGTLLIQYDTIEQKSFFLRRLEEAAKNVANPDPISGLPTMLSGTHIFMTGHVSRRVQEELGLGDHDEKGIPSAIDGIAAIKIFGLLLESMRARLHSYLQSWLLGTDSKYLAPGDISAMSTVITQLWLQRMKTGVGREDADYFQAKVALR